MIYVVFAGLALENRQYPELSSVYLLVSLVFFVLTSACLVTTCLILIKALFTLSSTLKDQMFLVLNKGSMLAHAIAFLLLLFSLIAECIVFHLERGSSDVDVIGKMDYINILTVSFINLVS